PRVSAAICFWPIIPVAGGLPAALAGTPCNTGFDVCPFAGQRWESQTARAGGEPASLQQVQSLGRAAETKKKTAASALPPTAGPKNCIREITMAHAKGRLWRLSTSVPFLLALAFSGAHAQQADDPEAPGLEGEVEQITVTGSRISRDSFSSPSPIQVLDVESGRQLGIASITEMLQRSTVANGQQIDATLNTNAGNSNATEAPPTGGVGSSNIDLRGLGPARTLILVNGRRMGSVGVRGAPAQPDISLIPFALVDRGEVLTEGVSAVYGADAVAGVVNVILRDDFEGFELTLNSEIPGQDGGEIGQVSMIAGAQSDRASIIFGAEMFDRS